MANELKEKAADMGNKIAEGAEKAVDYVKEKTGMGDDRQQANFGTAGIKDHMDVFASCGTKVGVVDHLEGGAIKLTRNDSPDGQHHFIPTDWVDHVDNSVHLKCNSREAAQNWKSNAAACGCAT